MEEFVLRNRISSSPRSSEGNIYSLMELEQLNHDENSNRNGFVPPPISSSEGVSFLRSFNLLNWKYAKMTRHKWKAYIGKISSITFFVLLAVMQSTSDIAMLHPARRQPWGGGEVAGKYFVMNGMHFQGLQKFFTGYVCESCDSAAHEQLNNVAAQTRALTFQRFESVPDLLGYYSNEENQRLWREGGMYSMMPCSIHMAGLVFNKTDADGEWKYTIHTPEGCTPEMKKYIQSPPTSGDMDNLWLQGMFIRIQMMADQFILNNELTRNNREGPKQLFPPKIVAKNYPTDSFRSKMFFGNVPPIRPLYMGFAFMTLFISVASEVVQEKHLKIKETLGAMGMSRNAYWTSTVFCSYMSFLPATLFGSWLAVNYIVPDSHDPTALVALLCLLPLALVLLGAAVSTLFDDIKRVNICTGALSMLLVVVFYGAYKPGVPRELKFLSALSPFCAMSLGIFDLASLGHTNFGAWDAIWMLVFDCALFALLTWYLDHVSPKEFGRSYGWLFCLGKRPSGYSALVDDEAGDMVALDIGPTIRAENREPLSRSFRSAAESGGIELKGLTKCFESLTAVNEVDLHMVPGQVFGLLGHNGAGKTTIINVLTGLLEPTRGDATVCGMSITDNLDALRKIVGVCPQENILWPYMTAFEHLVFYAELKGVPKHELQPRCRAILDKIGLTDKMNTLSSELSGGMKRRLSFGMAMAGNPKVIILDEPTTGLDPESRRHIWDLIKELKRDRVIVLTTHMMDEADLLSDRIAVMSRGRIFACGTPLFLRTRFGHGYNLSLSVGAGDLESGTGHCVDRILDSLHGYVAGARLFSESGRELRIQLPHSEVSNFPKMFDMLDSNGSDLGIASYGIAETNLEDVFLAILRLDEDSKIIPKNVANGIGDESGLESQSSLLVRGSGVHEPRLRFLTHVKANILKRWWFFKRDRFSFLARVLFPLLILAVVLSFMDGTHDMEPYPLEHKYGQTPDSEILLLNSTRLHEEFPVSSWPEKDVRTVDMDFDMFAELNHDGAIRYRGTTLEIIPKLEAINGLPVILNELSTARIRTLSDNPKVSIGVSSAKLPLPVSQKRQNAMVQAVMVAFLLLDVLLAVPTEAFTFLVIERKCGAKHQQMFSGMSMLAFWTGNILWDLAPTVVHALATVLTIVTFQVTLFTGHNLLILCGLVVLQIFSNLGFVYCMSLIFTKEHYVKTIMMFAQYVCIGAVGITAVMQKLEGATAIALAALPGNGLLTWTGELLAHYIQDPDGPMPGHNLSYKYFAILATTAAFYVCLLSILQYFKMRKKEIFRDEEEQSIDDDVEDEKRRIQNQPVGTDAIEIHGLRKVFKKDKLVAVKDMWFGVPQGQCFGFLGVNGAGKTTTLSMVTGSVDPSSGTAYIGGYSCLRDSRARLLAGLCPQEAPLLEKLSAREHITLFGMIKGIPSNQLESIVDELICSLNLGPHADKPVRSLSGGNKRKCCAAIALIGSPRVVLLDEPSTGMDPAARRSLWNFISDSMSSCAVILTTHSMEECEALCERIAIMVKGELSCIGTAQHLKNKFAKGHQLTVIVSSGDDIDNLQKVDSMQMAAVEAVSSFVLGRFSGASVLEQHGSSIQLQLPPHEGSSLATIFRTMEENKQNLSIEAYGVSQTTLEQVFLHHAAESDNEDTDSDFQ
eukprot:186422_1